MGAVAATGINTYPIDMDPDYFYTAAVLCPDYYPYLFNDTPMPYLSPGVGVGGWVNNCAPGLGDQYWNGTTDEDINGTVDIDASVPLIAIFQYTGTGTPPPYLDVLVRGSVSANAQSDILAGNWYSDTPIDPSELSVTFSASDGLGESVLAMADPTSSFAD